MFTIHICIFGASITWGANDAEGGGWTDRLKTHVWQKRDFETDVYNCGISGDKVANVLKRFDVEATARKADKIIFSVGINDSPHSTNPQGTPLEEFKDQYRQLIKKAEGFTKDVIFVGLTNVDEDIEEKNYKNDEIQKYDKVMQEIAAEKGLRFVSLFGSLNKEELTPDGLHPNANGHKKIFEKVLAGLVEKWWVIRQHHP